MSHVPYGSGVHLALALALHYELLLGDQSLWSGYLQSLPLESELSIGLFWAYRGSVDDIDAEKAREWFLGTEVEQYLLYHPDPGVAILKEIEEYYRDIASPLLMSLGVLHWTMSGFQHAYSLVSSRAFMVDAYHGLAMVPIADAFNHTQENHVHLETDFHVCVSCGSLSECVHDAEELDPSRTSKHTTAASMPGAAVIRPSSNSEEGENSCEMVVNAPISPYEEVFNTYGEKLTNAELLLRYGFTLDGNENDVVSWTVAQVWEACGCAGKGLDEKHIIDVIRTWPMHTGWEDSSLVVNTDIEGETPPLHITADGAITHHLWTLCVLAACSPEWKGKSIGDIVATLERVAEVQSLVEQMLDEGECMASDSMAYEAVSAEALRKVFATIVVLCRKRMGRIGGGMGSEAIGEHLDTIPRDHKKTRAAMTHALECTSMLESCESRWKEMEDIVGSDIHHPTSALNIRLI
ncbi:SET domain-containing protein [Stereum hirsutum FP-91666 SS1]|uniref:SET domain-containing protein n=1 Tax=Stereum hirsutum (strain FP-91666) TaxID=721885 RepID=UPI000444A617|nr:SET domain-containing protein [Stereum hirsutum FP-91666 SS1]EIM80783.1 SET domain-containing protein [Stereum hirsutum FP-91666 SS1]